MRKTLLFFCLFITNIAFAQINDDFSDGNFSVNPIWTGNDTKFTVNSDFKLQSAGDNATAQTIYLSTPNTLFSNVLFEVLVNLDFDPSTTNYPRIYLSSNSQDLSLSTLSGYYLQLGSGTNKDNFTLHRQVGSSSTVILQLADKNRPSASTVNVRVRVEKTIGGRWDIYTDFTGGTNFTWDGSFTEATGAITTSSYFGVYCKYATANRYASFKFDDVRVVSFTDQTGPKITSLSVSSSKSLEISFDEPVDLTSNNLLSNISIGNVNPVSAAFGTKENVVVLTFAEELSEGNSTLNISSISDQKGNISTGISSPFTYIKAYNPVKGDIVINEIFARVNPSVGLPNREFLELYNTTDKYIIITDWRIKDGGSSPTTGRLSADTLAPKAYTIVCPDTDVSKFKAYGKTTTISSLPTLNDDGDDLTLMLPDATTIIDEVNYRDTWYNDAVKKNGGYSLELINPNSLCTGSARWSGSVAAIGGTPGAQNSIYEATFSQIKPKLVGANVLDERTVQLNFDRALDVNTLNVLSNYTVNNGVGSPVSASPSTNSRSVTLNFSNAIGRGIANTITVQNVASCSGIVIDATANSAQILLAKEINVNDVLISEVLFNPKTGSNDFIEIYNNSDFVIDLKDLTIANPTLNGPASQPKLITNNSIFVQPKQYWVLSANPSNVTDFYDVLHPNQVVTVPSMPNYNNGSGTVTLLRSTEKIDEFSYDENMHHVLLKEVKGVSLERVSFDKLANASGNFQSAAASIGYATPTGKNSQSEDLGVKSSFKVSNKTFSPDNDGFEDLLNIDYQFKQSGNLGTVNVYNDKGILVRKLARNISFSTKGTITWDGLTDGGQPCKVGIYFITADFFNLNGTQEKFKQTCVLAAKLN